MLSCSQAYRNNHGFLVTRGFLTPAFNTAINVSAAIPTEVRGNLTLV